MIPHQSLEVRNRSRFKNIDIASCPPRRKNRIPSASQHGKSPTAFIPGNSPRSDRYFACKIFAFPSSTQRMLSTVPGPHCVEVPDTVPYPRKFTAGYSRTPADHAEADSQAKANNQITRREGGTVPVKNRLLRLVAPHASRSVLSLTNIVSPKTISDNLLHPRFMKSNFSAATVEILKLRIAPASITGNVLSYTDLQGDHVKVTFSKGPIASSEFTFNNLFSSTGPQQLQLIDLNGLGSTFDGTNITVSVTKAPGGDGLAAIGYISATSTSERSASLAILVESARARMLTANVAIKSLTVDSIGLYGTATQGGSPSSASTIKGSLGSLSVAHDIQSATLTVTDSVTGTNAEIGSISIGGDISFGVTIGSATGAIGPVKIGGNIDSGATILGDLGIGAVTITGDLLGTVSSSGGIGAVKISGSTVNGAVTADTDITSLSVGGLMTSGSNISAGGSIGAVKVGSSINDSTTISGADGIASVTVAHLIDGGSSIKSSAGSIGPVHIGASVGDGSSITADTNIGDVVVAGSILGGSSITSTAGFIGTVKIGGTLGSTLSGDMGIGNVAVGQDMATGAITPP